MPDGKHLARRMFQRTLASIDIAGTMERKFPLDETRLILPDGVLDFAEVDEVRAVAIGKAAHAMVAGLPALLPNGISLRGVVSAPTPPDSPAAGLRYFTGGHPTPNEASWKAAEAILELLQGATERTLLVFLLSGGGSALVEKPLDPAMTLADVQVVHRALVQCGAPIDEINVVRKHFSAVKGGRLAQAAGRAKKITLAVTDVPAGKESALASGPTIADPTTIADAERVLKQYGLREKFPASLRAWLDAGKMPETPKRHDTALTDARFYLLLGLDDLFHAAHHAVEAHGYVCCCDNTTDDWPLERAADTLLSQLEQLRQERPGQKVAIVADGEVASPVTGNGIGGRNSAFVLACAERIAGKPITVLSAGTDGIDGNSPAAGAVADGETLERARALGMDPADFWQRSDAYTFFSRLDDDILTGPTGNNLRDLRILLAEA